MGHKELYHLQSMCTVQMLNGVAASSENMDRLFSGSVVNRGLEKELL